MPKIKIEDLSFEYVNKKITTSVFSHLNLEIKNEVITSILGHSGCGKTTLFRLITGVEQMDEGNIYFDDKLMNDVDPFKRNIAFLSQNISLYPFYTIFRNMAFPLLLEKKETYEIRERVREMAKLFHIEHCLNRKPKHISLGQQQLVAIAKCLLNEADLYIFDEPFSHLDANNKMIAKTAIKQFIKEKKKTCIITSHDINDIYSLSDEIIVIEEGEIIYQDSPENLLNSDNPSVQILLGEKDG